MKVTPGGITPPGSFLGACPIGERHICPHLHGYTGYVIHHRGFAGVELVSDSTRKPEPGEGAAPEPVSPAEVPGDRS